MQIGRYTGGKGRIYQHIINEQPPHRVYAELFLGGGSVLLNKRPAQVNVGIDLDPAVIDVWQQWLVDTGKNDDAAATPDLAMMASTGRSGDGRRPWRFLCTDGVSWLNARLAAGDVGRDWLIYCDPPYLGYCRNGERPLYEYEMMTQREHGRLLDLLLRLPCKVQLSHYWCDFYADRLSDWRRIEIPTYDRGGNERMEVLWMNYAEPVRLHDYSHLGEDFRERERIKRKAKRWVAGLERLPVLERRAILSAIEERFYGS